jgi:MFS family permease
MDYAESDESLPWWQRLKVCVLEKLNMEDPAKRAVWILFLANLLNYMDRFTVAGILTHITKEFHLSSAQTGLLQTVFIIAYMIAAPIFGYLGDRYSRKSIMIGGIIVWSISVFCCTFVPSNLPGLFFFFRAIVGVGEASYAVIAPSLIADMFSDTHRSTMLMFFYIATPFGSGLGYGIGSEITLLTGSWRWGLRLTPILGMFVLFLIIKFLEEPTRGQVDFAYFERTSLKQDLIYLSKIKTFWLCTAAFTSSVFVIGALSWWTPTIAEYAYGAIHGGKVPEFAKANISIIFGFITCSAGLIGVIIGSSISKVLRQSHGNNQDTHVKSDPIICAAGSLLATPLMFLALVFTATSMNVGWILIFIAVTCMCVNWAVNVDIIMYTVMPPRRALASALQTMVSHLLGDAFSPYLVGLIADGIRGGHGLTPDALTKYTALEYALFVPNFFLILSGACYLLASFFVTDDAENCFLEIHRGQNRRAEIIGESYSHEETEEFPTVNAIVNAPIDIQTETPNPSTVIVASDPIDINDRNPLIRPQ